jgi:ankyrin repeat protein
MAQSDIDTAQQRASEWKLVQKGFAPLQPEEVAQIQPVQLPVVDPSTVEQLNSQEAKLRLKELGVPIDKDSFFEAAKTDNLGVFKLLHKAGADLETPWGSARVTPLYMATDHGARSVFDYLLTEGANVNAANQTDGMTPLVRAIAWDHQHMINRLLDAGASARQDPNERGIFGSSPLQYAVIGDDPDLIRRLFKHGASVDELYARKETPLMLAASKSREVFQVLIEYGTDPNAVDENGKSVLHHILEPPIDTVILHLALEAGADPNSEAGIPITPLLEAVYIGDPGAVKQLLDYGARLDRTYAVSQSKIPMDFSQDVRRIIMNEGTALMVAAQLGHASVAKILLIYGADEDQKIAIGDTQFRASDLGCSAGHDLVCNMLR